MVENHLSVDAAARLWGLKSADVRRLVRSDTMRIPEHVRAWLQRHQQAAARPAARAGTAVTKSEAEMQRDKLDDVLTSSERSVYKAR